MIRYWPYHASVPAMSSHAILAAWLNLFASGQALRKVSHSPPPSTHKKIFPRAYYNTSNPTNWRIFFSWPSFVCSLFYTVYLHWPGSSLLRILTKKRSAFSDYWRQGWGGGKDGEGRSPGGLRRGA